MKRDRRRRLQLNYIEEPGLKISVARTYEELKAAHQLCYNVYLKEGYTHQNTEKMRLSLHHSLPTTTTFIATYNGEVIGTLMAISDSSLGLPSDSIFDLSPLKNKYQRLVEGSGYAIDERFRGSGGKIFFMLYKFFFKFVTEYLGADLVIAAINPKQKSFYSNVLLFEEESDDIVPHKSAAGNPAVLLTLDLHHYKDKYLVSYGHLPKEQNLYQYMFDFEPDYLEYPEKKSFLAGYPTMTPNVFQQIFKQDSKLLNQLGEKEIDILRNIYGLKEYDGAFQTNQFCSSKNRRFRLASKAFVNSVNGVKLTKPLLVKDVSEHGLMIKYNDLPKIMDDSPHPVGIEINGAEYDLVIQPAWQNQTHVGYKIINPPLHWIRLIREAHKSLVKEEAPITAYHPMENENKKVAG